MFALIKEAMETLILGRDLAMSIVPREAGDDTSLWIAFDRLSKAWRPHA